LFRGPSYERPRMILLVYGLFIILLMISSWVFIYSRDNALAQITSGPNLLMVMHMVLSISLFTSTSQGWVVLAQRLVNRGVYYGAITMGIVVFYLVLSWVLGLLLTQMFGLQSRTVTIFAAVISTAGLFSLREFVQRYIDRMFFRTRYRYGELLKETSERFSSIMELPRLFSSLLKIIGASMKLRSGAAWVVKAQRGDLLFVSSWGKTENLPPVIAYGKIKKIWDDHQKSSVVLRDSAKDQAFFTELGAQCVVPLFFQGEIYGLIALGTKIEDIPYGRDDVDLLESIGKQAAAAVKNSMSYTTILNLNASLSTSKIEIERLKGKLEVENVYLQKALQDAGRFGDIVGASTTLTAVKELIEKIAPTQASVVVLGESGTGKELVARTIHNLSPMSERPLVTVNCAAIPANLLESELFGHVKGAFTGAIRRKVGQFELADGGTLFLDEIGELPLELQPKILRALQEREITPVGAEGTIHVNVRLVTATNRDLEKMVKEGKFREDLYYRINVVPITLPPLRERAGDIPLLAQYFLEMHTTRMGKKVEAFSRGAMERLLAYNWPGNVRELSNVVERAVALSSGTAIDTEVMLPEVMKNPKNSHASQEQATVPLLESNLPYKEAVDAFKRQYVREVLEKVGGNKSEAARLIGLQRPYLHKLIRELGVEDSD
ncbi:sigma 54-interacting transcriptional regulator, partial [Myxococcota bacterium]|nr:sigma 54-interacting transcriptional regulator [Myxococcota bacterium]